MVIFTFPTETSDSRIQWCQADSNTGGHHSPRSTDCDLLPLWFICPFFKVLVGQSHTEPFTLREVGQDKLGFCRSHTTGSVGEGSGQMRSQQCTKVRSSGAWFEPTGGRTLAHALPLWRWWSFTCIWAHLDISHRTNWREEVLRRAGTIVISDTTLCIIRGYT